MSPEALVPLLRAVADQIEAGLLPTPDTAADRRWQRGGASTTALRAGRA